MKTWTALVLTALLDSPVQAHHAGALFDHSQTLAANGNVREYLWANPHTNIYLEVADGAGRSDLLIFEGGPAIAMRRSGWAQDTLKVGDKINIRYYPRRDLKPGGQLVSATLADGRTLNLRLGSAP
jgi:hypothetical protein